VEVWEVSEGSGDGEEDDDDGGGDEGENVESKLASHSKLTIEFLPTRFC
jgi:hypothetical protein